MNGVSSAVAVAERLDAVPHALPEAEPAARRPLFVVMADIRELERSSAARWIKRAIDIAGSAVALVLLSPLFIGALLAVKLTSRGPILFVQDRCGLGGQPFRFYKFRTMVVDAEARKAELAHLNEVSGPAFKMKRDPRITRVGALLRKLSVDELPQLWNVLRGDMSLVGPRPPTPGEVEHYTAHQAQRLAVIPGITGLWQVSGRSTIADFDQWVELDLAYAREWSVWLDVKILARTPLVVLGMRGAA